MLDLIDEVCRGGPTGRIITPVSVQQIPVEQHIGLSNTCSVITVASWNGRTGPVSVAGLMANTRTLAAYSFTS